MGLRRWSITRNDETPNGTFVRKVGTMVEFDDGTRKLNLFMFPQEFNVVEDNEQTRHLRRMERRQKEQQAQQSGRVRG